METVSTSSYESSISANVGTSATAGFTLFGTGVSGTVEGSITFGSTDSKSNSVTKEYSFTKEV